MADAAQHPMPPPVSIAAFAAQARPVLVRPTPAQIGAWAAVTALALLLAVRFLPKFQLGAHSDDAHYVVLAQSLVMGGPYARLYEPGAPGTATYPLGLPLLLAPLVWLFPNNFEILKLVPFASTFISLVLIFWGWPVLGRGASHWWAVGLAALFAFQPLTIRSSGVIMSEGPFLAACLVSLWLVERVAQHRAGRYWPIWLGLGLTAAVAIRTVGIALPVAAGMYLLYRRGRAVLPGLTGALAAGLCAVALIVLLTPLSPSNLWPSNYIQHQSALVAGEARHTSQDDPYLTLLLRVDLRHLHTDLRNLFIPFGSGVGGEAFAARLGLPWLLRAVGYALSGCVILGLVLAIRRWGLTAFLAFAVTYYVMMQAVLWTSHRLLYPIHPQLALGLLLGLDGFARLALRASGRRGGWLARWSAPAVAATAILLAALGVWKSWMMTDSRLSAGDLEARTAWLEQVADPASILLSDLPHVDYLYSGLHAVQLETYAAPAALAADLARWQPDYLLVGTSVIAGPQGAIFDSLLAAGRLSLLRDDPLAQVAIFAVRP